VDAAPHRPGPSEDDHPVRRAHRPGIADRLFAIGAFAMFVILWVGFAMALRGNHAILDTTWDWLRGLPDPIQVVTWVIFLPIAVGLWIWESTWPPLLGIPLTVGMIAWTLIAVAGLRRAFGAA
jgi:hypothetical protein